MDVLTMGVEEEYLLVDRVSRAPVNRAPKVISALEGLMGEQVQAEFYNAQVEVCTVPTADRADLREQLVRLRGTVAPSASEVGCLLVASGVPVIAPQEPLTVTDNERYRRMARRFASLVGPSRMVCGCHVHVGALDRKRALALSNHIRPWLPVLQSLTGNSPVECGRDTGFDSWRSVAFSAWPTVGPPPLLDEPRYLEYVDGMVGSGVLLDRRMLYWYARPSEHVPTLEFRIADVNADVDTVVLLAALVRGLAGTLLAEADADVPPPQPATATLRRAHEMAAEHGIDGLGLDPVSGLERPAALLVERLLERAAPGLAAAGDLYAVESLWDDLRRQGTGASRQRAALRRTGSLRGVVDSLVVGTAAAAPLAG
ncbi:glutamate--cysteine ligase [Streptomyces sp. NBC_00190]|uniref:carboxylate-amine ligase n=1 Tax=unclassified Streptomyces TaxID=2593676 RepID=UPI002E2C7958|nr:glutamate--cysteine ligase [Streptomyces sp. NBC_00190]WSZ39161.1 glutamate--cysteine ligase [Streptomyces sp. NBC_00868]